jgi:ABC-2 type transport system ATP-binding protein
VIDKGRVIASGTPTQLKDGAGRASVVVTLTDAADLARAAELIGTCSPEMHVDEAARRIIAQADGLGDMTRIGEAIAASGIQVDDLGLKRPTLDDVFLHLTGHHAIDEPDQGSGDSRGEAPLEEVAR